MTTVEERREVDAACLRLLGYEPLDWDVERTRWRAWNQAAYSETFLSPCSDPVLVVPLAEALIAAGWEMGEVEWDVRGYRATLMRRTGPNIKGEFAPTMQEALALAAARAVGMEP